MATYFALFEPERKAGGYSVHFPDLPFGATQGENLAEAEDMAQDLLKCILGELIRRGEPIPASRKHTGTHFREIHLGALEAAKVALHLAFQQSGLSKAELGRRAGIAKPNIDRLFDLDHASRLDQLESAFGALGKRLEIAVTEAA
jgi:antitoxin HicB